MKKHKKILLIYTLLIISVFGMSGCEDEIIINETQKPEVTKEPKETEVVAYDSYVLSEVQNIEYENDIEYTQDGVVRCKLINIIMDENSVIGLEIRFDDNTREVFNLEDIEGKVRAHTDSNDNNIAEIEFYSGGKAAYVEGEEMNLFIDEEGYYTFDSSKSIGAGTRIYKGVITDFEFLALTKTKKDLVLEHIEVELESGTIVNVPIVDHRVKSINSKGEILIDYEGSINDKHLFSVNVDEDFGLQVNYNDGSSELYSKGNNVELIKIDSENYAIAVNFDNSIYIADVTEFLLRQDNKEVIGIDGAVFEIDEMDNVTMTMADFGCDYAIPFGNFLREYSSMDGSDDVLLNVKVSADFGLELYYNERARLVLDYEESVGLYRDFYGNWHIDAY